MLAACLACEESPRGHNNSLQVAPYTASIQACDTTLLELEELRCSLAAAIPELVDFGEKRANRAFNSTKDTTTKPSYVGRIRGTSGENIDQLEHIVSISGNEQKSGGLVFSVFLPSDYTRRNRPGYIPCLLAGSFFEDREGLHLNAFFRSQSLVEFGLFDLIFLRNLQEEMLARISEKSNRNDLVLGPLNLFFSRILIQRQMLKKGNKALHRDKVLPYWKAALEEFVWKKRLNNR